MLPSPAELSYFHEVCKTQNFSHAARTLKISQPALCIAIQKLEKRLDVDLFIRHKKGVILTPAGKQMLLQTKPLMQLWQDTRLQIQAAHCSATGEVRIGCHSTIGVFLHGFIPDLLEANPGLKISLTHAESLAICQQLIDLNLDLGIVSMPVQYPDLVIQKISETDTTFWVGEGKRNIQDIHAKEAVIICHPEVIWTQILFKQAEHFDIKNKRLLASSSVEVMASLTVNGCGIGILPESFVQAIYPGRLTKIPGLPSIKAELYLVYRKEYLQVDAIKLVLETIKKWVRSIATYKPD